MLADILIRNRSKYYLGLLLYITSICSFGFLSEPVYGAPAVKYKEPFSGACRKELGDLYFYARLGGYFGIRATGQVELLYSNKGLPDIFEMEMPAEVAEDKISPVFDALYTAFNHNAGVFICAYKAKDGGNLRVSAVSLLSPNAVDWPPVLKNIHSGDIVSGSPLFLVGYGPPGKMVNIYVVGHAQQSCRTTVSRQGDFTCDPVMLPDGDYIINLSTSTTNPDNTSSDEIRIKVKNNM